MRHLREGLNINLNLGCVNRLSFVKVFCWPKVSIADLAALCPLPRKSKQHFEKAQQSNSNYQLFFRMDEAKNTRKRRSRRPPNTKNRQTTCQPGIQMPNASRETQTTRSKQRPKKNRKPPKSRLTMALDPLRVLFLVCCPCCSSCLFLKACFHPENVCYRDGFCLFFGGLFLHILI